MIYYLYHEYETKDKFISHKGIGFFVSKKEAQLLIKEYQLLPGFKNHKNNFVIKEMHLDNLTHFSSRSVNTKDIEYIYTVYKTQELPEPNYEICTLLGCFTSETNALSFVDSLELPSNKIKDTIEIYKEKVGLAGWIDGFQSIKTRKPSGDGGVIEGE